MKILLKGSSKLYTGAGEGLPAGTKFSNSSNFLIMHFVGLSNVLSALQGVKAIRFSATSSKPNVKWINTVREREPFAVNNRNTRPPLFMKCINHKVNK